MNDTEQPVDDPIPTLPTWVRGAPRPEVPERVGHYRIEEKLGVGGAGEVWAAYDEVLDRRIALKLVPRGRVGDEQEARLLREAHALAKLSHRNVVTVHDSDRIEDFVYIAMELVEGGTLKTAFDDRSRDTRSRVELLCQAARGLHAAHRLGLVHRDFKPANALLGRDGRVRVADFGLARLAEASTAPAHGMARLPVAPTFDELTITGAILGTPAYMSPEQRMGQRLTPASDQFSFCVVAWLALYGVNPLANLDLAAWIAGDASIEPPRDTKDVPAALHEVLLQGLEPEPAARHPSLLPVIRALERSLTRRGPAWLPWAGAAVVITAVALGAFAWISGTEDPCAGAALGWPAIDRPVTTAHLHDGTDEGLAAARTASAGLHALATNWADQAEAACRAGAAPSSCQQQQAAAATAVVELLRAEQGRSVVPELLAALHTPCGDVVTSNTVELARLRPRLAAGDAPGVVAECVALEQFDQDTPKVRAQILRLRGAALRRSGDAQAALDTLRVAYNNAERAGDVALAAAVAAEVAVLIAVDFDHPARSRVWLEIAERVPDPPPALETSVAMARGRVLEADGSWADAADAYRRAAELQRDAPPYLEGPSTAQLRAGRALLRAGRRDEARPLLEAALQRRRQLYGPAHAKTQAAQRIAGRL